MTGVAVSPKKEFGLDNPFPYLDNIQTLAVARHRQEGSIRGESSPALLAIGVAAKPVRGVGATETENVNWLSHGWKADSLVQRPAVRLRI